ncbi:MAG: GNAT family N-acetyltransferase [Thermoplasmata archaeon]
MTVREYRRGDWVGVAALWQRNPLKEMPLLGLDPDAMGGVLRKTEGLGVRFALGLARLFGRPIFIVLVADVGGQVMGTTLLNFTPETAYVSQVVVDTSVRRQGHAQAMLRACDDLCRKYHRPYVVLDVLSQNDPAIRLYKRWGYQPLRDQVWLARTLGPEAPLPAPGDTTRVRPFTTNDGPRLAELDNALMSPEVRKILPRHRGDFHVPRTVRRNLESDMEAWVAEINGRPVGFLRSTVSRLMQAANLSSPLFGGDVPAPVARDLLLTALRWAESQKAPRVLTEVPEHQWRMRPLLDSLGFVEQFRLHTLVHRLGA